MKAWVLEQTAPLVDQQQPLVLRDLEIPEPGEQDILIRVRACGICHTELDEIEGRLAARLPVIPGHQVVGEVKRVGPQAGSLKIGDRVGVAWIFSSCGHCFFCASGRENLCAEFRGTGKDANGGYAQYMTVPAAYAHAVPEELSDIEAAPLLCAGAIGYRSLELTGIRNGDSLGLTGFGGSGHLVLKMVRYRFPDTKISVFARNPEERFFALELGAGWAGDITQSPPELQQAIIDTTPVWQPVVSSLENLLPGGRLVINAIRKEVGDVDSLLQLDYDTHLWREKEIKSVANVCRSDVAGFLKLAAEAGIKPDIEVYPFAHANRALLDLKHKKIRGAKVLQVR